MSTALRKTGVTLVPFFTAGLRDEECCIGVISEPLTEREAWEALGRAVPDLERRTADRTHTGPGATVQVLLPAAR
jgi:hypothetical protein